MGLSIAWLSLFAIALPYLYGINGSSRWMHFALAFAGIIYSAITDYELAVISLLAMRSHLLLDFVFGAAMLAIAASSGLPGASSLPAATVGALAIVLALTTKTRPTRSAAASGVKLRFRGGRSCRCAGFVVLDASRPAFTRSIASCARPGGRSSHISLWPIGNDGASVPDAHRCDCGECQGGEGVNSLHGSNSLQA
jgi:hypothetical protein